MRAHELTATSSKSRRSGRGISAGRGKTSGRGTKGQNARSGGKRRPGFEGGQNPLMMRLPKLPGFNSRRTPTQTVKLSDLNLVSAKTIDNHALLERGLIKNAYAPVKIVSGGELKAAKTIKVALASKNVAGQIEKVGGSFESTAVPKRTGKSKTAEKAKK